MIGIALDRNTYKELRKESARRGLEKAEMCQRIVRQWLSTTKKMDFTEITQHLDQISSKMKEIHKL